MPWNLLSPPHYSDTARAGVDATVVGLALPAVVMPDVSGMVQLIGAAALLLTAASRTIDSLRMYREHARSARAAQKDGKNGEA